MPGAEEILLCEDAVATQKRVLGPPPRPPKAVASRSEGLGHAPLPGPCLAVQVSRWAAKWGPWVLVPPRLGVRTPDPPPLRLVRR